jgi:hypothetical protein
VTLSNGEFALVEVLDTSRENNLCLQWWRRNCNINNSKASFFSFFTSVVNYPLKRLGLYCWEE